jgi:hypothetical protein
MMGEHCHKHMATACGCSEEPTLEQLFPDIVAHPKHYAGHFPFEAIEVIEWVLNKHSDELTPFQSYCLGNEMKYRLRAGFKGDAAEDIAKAMKYNEFRQGGKA